MREDGVGGSSLSGSDHGEGLSPRAMPFTQGDVRITGPNMWVIPKSALDL